LTRKEVFVQYACGDGSLVYVQQDELGTVDAELEFVEIGHGKQRECSAIDLAHSAQVIDQRDAQRDSFQNGFWNLVRQTSNDRGR
jgi:hypothetical protein